MGHESKCSNIHGHNYVMWIHATAPETDSIGRIIDFSVLKDTIGKWVDTNWDHTFIAYERDFNLISDLKKYEKTKPVWIADFNPTAENMAEWILKVVAPSCLKDTGVQVYRVELYETENCKADAKLKS